MRIPKTHIVIGTLVFCIFAFASPSPAQQAPGIGGAVREAAPPEKEAPTKKEVPSAPVIVEEEKPFTIPEGEKIFIKNFRFEGIIGGDERKLSELLAPYKGKDLTMAGITEAANKVTLFYRDKGYLVAKAYIPKQDARDGILTIKVIIGSYGTFSLKNTSLVRDFLIQGVFDYRKDVSPVVTKDSLERSIFIIKDMPGCSIPAVTVMPGREPGTSDFEVKVDRSQRFNGYLMGDNQGSKYTGRIRGYTGLDVNSPFGIADRLSVAAMTTEKEGLENLRVSYGFPIFPNGLRGEVAASRTVYELGGIYSDLEAKGSADIVEAAFSYPIKKTRTDTLDLSLNIAHKVLKDDLNAVDLENPRDVTVGSVTLKKGRYGTLSGRSYFITVTGGISLGTMHMRDGYQRELNEAGADSQGTFSKANLTLTGNMDLTEKLSLRGSFKAQQVLSAHNVDSAEQFFISGTGGVKAYTESVSFDDGYVAGAELRYMLPAFANLRHALGLFADHGWVFVHDGRYTTKDDIILNDVGLGYYVSHGPIFGSVQLAQPVGKTSVRDPGTRVLVQVGIAF